MQWTIEQGSFSINRITGTKQRASDVGAGWPVGERYL